MWKILITTQDHVRGAGASVHALVIEFDSKDLANTAIEIINAQQGVVTLSRYVNQHAVALYK